MSVVATLFWTFFKIGLLSIGGGYAIIPLIQEQVVDRFGWISTKMFTDIITISQMTPGPLAINTSTFVGLQIEGIPGAVAATAGCVFCGIVICLFLYCFFQRHEGSAYVFAVLKGLKSTSLGLILSAAATILTLAFWGSESIPAGQALSGINWMAVGIFAAAFFLLRRWKPNPILVMVASGLAGLLFYL